MKHDGIKCHSCQNKANGATVTVNCVDDDPRGPNQYTFRFCKECYHYFDKGIIPSLHIMIGQAKLMSLKRSLEASLRERRPSSSGGRPSKPARIPRRATSRSSS